MNGYFTKGGQLEQRKLGQKVIDDYNNLQNRIKRIKERLETAQDELALFHGMFPELKPTSVDEVDDAVGGTDNTETELPSL